MENILTRKDCRDRPKQKRKIYAPNILPKHLRISRRLALHHRRLRKKERLHTSRRRTQDEMDQEMAELADDTETPTPKYFPDDSVDECCQEFIERCFVLGLDKDDIYEEAWRLYKNEFPSEDIVLHDLPSDWASRLQRRVGGPD